MALVQQVSSLHLVRIPDSSIPQSSQPIHLSRTAGMMVHLVEEANDLAGHVFPSRFLVIHYTRRGRENDVPELTRW